MGIRPPAMDLGLQHDFAKLDRDLMDAVTGDVPTLQSFVSRLATLRDAATAAITSNSLTVNTMNAIRSFTMTGSAIVESALRIGSLTNTETIKHQNEVCEVFSRLSLLDAKESFETPLKTKPQQRDPTRKSKNNNRDVPTSLSDSSSIYTWLIEHVHNPYPSNAMKNKLAVEHGASFKQVNDWFSNMRRRIGWSAIVKRHFRGSRSLAVDCAYRIFRRNDDEALSPEVKEEFYRVKRKLESLYEEKSFEAVQANIPTVEELVTNNATEILVHDKPSGGNLLAGNSSSQSGLSETNPSPSRLEKYERTPKNLKRKAITKISSSELMQGRPVKRRNVETHVTQTPDVSLGVTTTRHNPCLSEGIGHCPSQAETPIPGSSLEGYGPKKRGRSTEDLSDAEPTTKRCRTNSDACVTPESLYNDFDFSIPLQASLGSISPEFSVDHFDWAKWDAENGSTYESSVAPDILDVFSSFSDSETWNTIFSIPYEVESSDLAVSLSQHTVTPAAPCYLPFPSTVHLF